MSDNPWGGESGGGGTAVQPSSKPKSKLGRSKDIASSGFKKTKVVATVGFQKTKVVAKKVKKGVSVSVKWIKVKYGKSKLFQKK